MSINNDEYIENLDTSETIDFDDADDTAMTFASSGIKSHLEEGDQIVWYKDPNIIATWHTDGTVDLAGKEHLSICSATFYASKGHWRDNATEHGVGKEPQHWIFNGNTIKDIQEVLGDFWGATDKPAKKGTNTRKKKVTTENNADYEPIKVEAADWELEDYKIFRKTLSPLKSVICYEVNYNIFEEYSVNALDKYINNNGVYIMLNGSEPYYVGQADNVFNRVQMHTTDKHSGKWEKALLFVSKNNELTKDYQDVLEMRLIDETAGRGAKIVNGTIGNKVNATTVYSNNTMKYDSIIRFIAEASYKLGYDFLVRSTYSNNTVNAIGNAQTELAKDESKTNVIVTPKWVVKDMLDSLPEQAFGYGTTILDFAIKDGAFLQSAFERSFNNKDLITRFPDENRRKLYISQFKLFGVIQAATQDDYGIDLYANLNGIISKEHLIVVDYEKELFDKDNKILKGNSLEILAKDIIQRFGDTDMKIDYVVGNPPYQIVISEENGNTKPIYDKFIEMGINVASENVAMITNNTFLTNDSKAELREKMIKAGLKTMVNYPVSGEIFNGVGVSACYFNIDKKNTAHNFEYTKIVDGTVTNNYKTILNDDSLIFDDKILSTIQSKFVFSNSMESISLTNKTFGINSNLRIGFDGKGPFITKREQGIKLYYIDEKSKKITNTYMDENDIPKGKEYIARYKVMCRLAVAKPSYSAFNETFVLDKESIFTQSWTCIGCVDTLQECDNIMKYAKTRTFKIGVLMHGTDGMINVNPKLLSYIPAFDFTSNKDVDWSLSTDEIDNILFNKFGFTDEEKEYIKKSIK